MYKRILVAIDGSETGQGALDEALMVAREGGAQLRIVHVVDEVSLSRDPKVVQTEADTREQYESAMEVLEKAVGKAKEAGVEASTKLLKVDKLKVQVADLIAGEAEAWPADLIVVGTHGRRGVRRLLQGSVAESVARIASTPVLLIRGE